MGRLIPAGTGIGAYKLMVDVDDAGYGMVADDVDPEARAESVE
jgi:hypothetical protein